MHLLRLCVFLSITLVMFFASCSNVRVAKGFKSKEVVFNMEKDGEPDIRTVEQLIENTDLEQYSSDDDFDLSSLTLDKGMPQKHKIPHEINTSVKRWIHYFTKVNRDWFQRTMTRSEKFEAQMKNILIQYGVPEELFYVAFIESGFVQKARSRAGAQGIWQFMKGTGKMYGLKINNRIDERNNPYKATAAAAAHLRDLYNIYGSWYLAIASYNAGEFRIRNAILRHKERNFWDLVEKKALPSETMDYVPKYMAARIVAENHSKFGFQYNGPSKDAETVEEEIMELVNNNKFDRIMPSSRSRALTSSGKYRVKRGDNLWTISRKLKISINKLKRCNPSLNNNRIYPNQRINTTCSTPLAKNTAKTINPRSSNSTNIYTARRGDNLWNIAKKNRTTVSELRRCNDTLQRHQLFIGQKVVLSCENNKIETVVAQADPTTSVAIVHTVKRGESLWSIAQKYKVSISEIAQWNNLKKKHKIFAGRKLVINSGV